MVLRHGNGRGKIMAKRVTNESEKLWSKIDHGRKSESEAAEME